MLPLFKLSLINPKHTPPLTIFLPMAFHWIPPPPNTLKINVHGTSTLMPSPVANDSGIGAIYRDSEGALQMLTVGTIPYLASLENYGLCTFQFSEPMKKDIVILS